MSNLLAVDEKVKVMVVKSMFPDKISLRYVVTIICLIMPYLMVGINCTYMLISVVARRITLIHFLCMPYYDCLCFNFLKF